MALPCVVRSLTGVRQLINLYLLESAPAEPTCGPFEFSIAGSYVKLSGECGLSLGTLSAALARPVWYDYGHQTVAVTPAVSNGVLFTAGQSSMRVGGVECELSQLPSRHTLPAALSSMWATATTGNAVIWEGLISEYDADPGAGCQLSLQALGGSPGTAADGTELMLLPQTEMQGTLAVVCAAIAAVYLVGSASLYEQGPTVRQVHRESKETQLFLADGPLTALVATVSALMIGDPIQQLPWVIWQRGVLCGCVGLLFGVAVYLIYFCPDRRATTLRTVVELPLLVAVYSPLASSASKVVDLAALLLGLGTILIAMRTRPRPAGPETAPEPVEQAASGFALVRQLQPEPPTDVYDYVAKVTAVCIQAPALLAGIIILDDGFTQALAALALSLGVCAASVHASPSSPPSTATPLQ